MGRSSHLRAMSLRLVILVALVWPLPARGGEANQRRDPWVIKEVMIPMRDSVRLHTRIFTPTEQPEPLPFLLIRTPYGTEDCADWLDGSLKTMADERYIFVFQDIRGKFGSEGVFVMLRPARAPGDTAAIDEGTDAFDTMEWLLGNVPAHNGRVGMLGTSYLGWTTIMATLEPHPALKAVAPAASPADMWLGDDFFHNGAFRLSYGFEFAFALESGAELKDFAFDRYDTFDWYLWLGSLANVNERLFHTECPTWNDFVAHPSYDEFWKRQTMIPRIQGVNVPTLNVAGWWDQEDFYGPFAIYGALEKYDANGVNHLVVGPWNHGGWNGPGDRLGSIPFDGPTGKFFREEVQAPWFAYYLKDKGSLDIPEALIFESGSNRWRRWNEWPPKENTEELRLYFGADQTLLRNTPGDSAKTAFDSYVSDPAHPVPYRHRPIQATYFPKGSHWETWLVEDQRFVSQRPDVLCWESRPLDSDLVMAGEVTAHLFASTTGSDADWIVKLIDVYPEYYPENWELAGFQLMVSNEVFRGRYRKSFEKPEPITPDAVVEYSFSLHTQSYSFRKGHRLMVQVQSTWFPIIDRNPQTFVSNIFEAAETDFRPATHKIYRSPQYPSHVSLPVVIKTSP